MLTLFREIFTWWNHQTFGTRLTVLFFGTFVGKDSFGNKYYKTKRGNRLIIYNGEVDASKIPNEWYSWMHFTAIKIENTNELKKYQVHKASKGKKGNNEEDYPHAGNCLLG